jgi:hypothetical protein
MDKVTIDTHDLNHIPEDKRDDATSYESVVSLYTNSDEVHGHIPEGKSVGDVHIESHTRYTVTYNK